MNSFEFTPRTEQLFSPEYAKKRGALVMEAMKAAQRKAEEDRLKAEEEREEKRRETEEKQRQEQERIEAKKAEKAEKHQHALERRAAGISKGEEEKQRQEKLMRNRMEHYGFKVITDPDNNQTEIISMPSEQSERVSQKQRGQSKLHERVKLYEDKILQRVGQLTKDRPALRGAIAAGLAVVALGSLAGCGGSTKGEAEGNPTGVSGTTAEGGNVVTAEQDGGEKEVSGTTRFQDVSDFFGKLFNKNADAQAEGEDEAQDVNTEKPEKETPTFDILATVETTDGTINIPKRSGGYNEDDDLFRRNSENDGFDEKRGDFGFETEGRTNADKFTNWLQSLNPEGLTLLEAGLGVRQFKDLDDDLNDYANDLRERAKENPDDYNAEWNETMAKLAEILNAGKEVKIEVKNDFINRASMYPEGVSDNRFSNNTVTGEWRGDDYEWRGDSDKKAPHPVICIYVDGKNILEKGNLVGLMRDSANKKYYIGDYWVGDPGIEMEINDANGSETCNIGNIVLRGGRITETPKMEESDDDGDDGPQTGGGETPAEKPEPQPTTGGGPGTENTPDVTPYYPPEKLWGKSGDPHAGGEFNNISGAPDANASVTAKENADTNKGNEGYVDDNGAKPGSASDTYVGGTPPGEVSDDFAPISAEGASEGINDGRLQGDNIHAAGMNGDNEAPKGDQAREDRGDALQEAAGADAIAAAANATAAAEADQAPPAQASEGAVEAVKEGNF